MLTTMVVPHHMQRNHSHRKSSSQIESTTTAPAALQDQIREEVTVVAGTHILHMAPEEEVLQTPDLHIEEVLLIRITVLVQMTEEEEGDLHVDPEEVAAADQTTEDENRSTPQLLLCEGLIHTSILRCEINTTGDAPHPVGHHTHRHAYTQSPATFVLLGSHNNEHWVA
mmetsp:Transcript_7278/g.27252  ORF Transcript_7278/g.27252 Transcript_7278/m.27252 type:complete len:169 (-) Transcript_7278:90-596(-)